MLRDTGRNRFYHSAPAGSVSLSKIPIFRRGGFLEVSMGISERFHAKVRKTEEGCWEWTACRNMHGYGQIKDGTKHHSLAHRVSWELHVGPIPEGLKVLHDCDNPACVRPDHLYLGTMKDNSRDMARRGRQALQRYPELIRRGESHRQAKLTEQKVREIRARYAQGGTSLKALAAEYGVDKSAIHLVVKRRTWKDVP